MSEATRSVTMRMGVQAGDLGAPLRGMSNAAKTLNKDVRETENNFRQMAKVAASDVRTMDRSVQQLSHGFQGLTMNLAIAAGGMGAMGGHMGKVAQHAQTAAGGLAAVHSAALLFRGVATLTATAGATLAGYASSAITAAAATDSLAVATEKAAVAKMTDVGAMRAQRMALADVEMASYGQAAASRASGYKGFLSVGIGAAAGAGTAAAAGYGAAGQVGGAVVGGGVGHVVTKYGGTALKAAAGTAAGYVGGGAAGGFAIGGAVAAEGIAVGLILQEYIRKSLGMKPGTAKYAQDYVKAYRDVGGQKNAKYQNKQQVIREAREKQYELSAGPRRQMEDRSRELGMGVTDLQDQYRPGQTAATHALATRIEGQASTVFRLPNGMQALRDSQGFDAHEAANRERIQDISRSTAGSSVQAAVGVTNANAEVGRASMEVARRQQALNDYRTAGNTTMGETLELEQNLSRAQQRLVDGEEKRLAALKDQGKATAENAGQWANFAKDQSKYYANLAQQERDHQKSLKQDLAYMDPRKQAQLLQIGGKLKNMQTGKGGMLTQDEVNMARGSGYLKDLTDKVALQYGGDRLNQTHQQLLQFGGSEKLQQAEQAQKAYAEIGVQIENKIQAELTLNEESLAQQLAEKVVPQVTGLIANLKDEMQQQINQASANQSIQSRAAHGP